MNSFHSTTLVLRCVSSMVINLLFIWNPLVTFVLMWANLLLGLNLKFHRSFLLLNKSPYHRHHQWHRVLQAKSGNLFPTTKTTKVCSRSLKKNQRTPFQRRWPTVIRPTRTPSRLALSVALPVRLKLGRSLRRCCEMGSLSAAQRSLAGGGSWPLAIASSNTIRRNTFSK